MPQIEIPIPEPEEATPSTKNAAHPLHAVFPRNSKIGAAIAWWSALWYMYQRGRSVVTWLKEQSDKKEKFTIGVSSWDEPELYSMIFQWVAENLEDDDKIDNYLLVTGYRKRKWVVSKGSSGKTAIKMDMAGVPVKISFAETEAKNGNATVATLRRDLVIKCASQEEVNTVTAFISEIWHRWNTSESTEAAVEPENPKYPYHVWTGNGWYIKRFSARSKDSVILKAGQSEDLFEDIERFLSLKSEYARVGVPWHRGFLFYGPAGTGKTSLALAVASSFEIPIYSLSLSTLENSKDLIKAISSMDGDEAVLIIEDIDVASTTHSRDSAKSKDDKVALDTLLNVLDGAGTPSGLITIMTTNYIDRLDDALIRPGRVDYRLLIDHLDDDQLTRMVKWYTGVEEFDLPKIESLITPADVTGAVKSYIGHPQLCLAQVKSLIEAKNES